MTKPTTRLGRYNLLLKEILKNTPKDHPDQKTIPQVMKEIKSFLSQVNEKSGKTENKFSLQILDERLSDVNNEYPQKVSRFAPWGKNMCVNTLFRTI